MVAPMATTPPKAPASFFLAVNAVSFRWVRHHMTVVVTARRRFRNDSGSPGRAPESASLRIRAYANLRMPTPAGAAMLEGTDAGSRP
jgi:hypothetical protein